MLTLARAAGVRAGEGRILALVALLFASLEAGRGFGEVGVDTLVVSRLGAATLPYLYIGLGATSLIAALGYGAALGRMSRTPLLAGILLGASILLIIGRLIVASVTEAVVPLIWLVAYASGVLASTITWTVAGSVFDARQAKRLFPLCTGAAIAGSFLGTLASGPAAHAAGTELLIVIEAGLLAIVALLVVSISRTGQVRVPVRRHGSSVVADVRVGFDEVVRSPLFRLVAVAYVLFSVLYFSVTYPFMQAAASAFPSEADLATAIGLLSAAITAASFVVSIVVANRVYARFGVATAAIVLPLVYLAGFVLWLVQFSFTTAALVRFVQQVTQRGMTNAAWSAFYNVIPTERRAQVLAFIDGVPGQTGMMLSGLLLLGAGRLFAADQVFWLGAGTAVLLTVVVMAIRRRYGASLLRTLRAGLGEQVLEGGPGLARLTGDPQIVDSLREALRAPEPAVRRMAVALLARTASPDAAGSIAGSLDDEDPAVRVAALDGLGRLAPDPVSKELVISRLADPDETVRAAAVRTSARLEPDGLPGLLAPLGGDPSPAVQAAVAVALDGLDARPGAQTRTATLLTNPTPSIRESALAALSAAVEPPLDGGDGTAGAATSSPIVDALAPALVRALDDDSSRARRTAAAILSSRATVPDGLLEQLTHGSPRAQEAALLALLGHGQTVRDEVGAWAGSQIGRATTCRAARLSLTYEARAARPDTALGFLAFLLELRERQVTDRALGALAVLGAPEARGVIRRCLRSDDQETRAQALEALDSIGDRRLGGAVVRLIDADSGDGAQSREVVLRRLTDDGDPWIRALARLALAEGGETAAMPETDRTIGDLDTMLNLRRIPLFQGLDPDDLQRIASTSIERVYPAGAALMREDEIGDELMVIVDGTVRVVRAEPDGSERLIRRYEAGDHIGELAVLRERPRIATVIAEGSGVRVLAISGENLKAILRERPEAAMAMLATLAERISTQ